MATDDGRPFYGFRRARYARQATLQPRLRGVRSRNSRPRLSGTESASGPPPLRREREKERMQGPANQGAWAAVAPDNRNGTAIGQSSPSVFVRDVCKGSPDPNQGCVGQAETAHEARRPLRPGWGGINLATVCLYHVHRAPFRGRLAPPGSSRLSNRSMGVWQLSTGESPT